MHSALTSPPKNSLFNEENVIYLFLAIFISALYLLFSNHFMFWGDELFSVDLAYKGTKTFLLDYFYSPDNHPILYYLIINIWQKIMFVNTDTDFLLRIPSIFFHFATVLFIIVHYCHNAKQKMWFFILTTVSSYFFMYSHMVRYYTLAAFMTVIAYFYFMKWVKGQTSLSKFVIASVLLMHIDYPSYLFFVVFVAIYYLVNRIPLKKNERIYILTQLISFMIVAYLIIRLYLVSGSESIAKNVPITIAAVVKFILGALFVPYHILNGEYLNLKLIPISLFFLLIMGMAVIWKTVKSKLDQTQKDLLLFIILQILTASIFLTFVTARYPVFSYARFILASGYFMFLLLVQLFADKQKYLLIGLLLFNINSLYSNISQKDFINPIYSIPTNLIKENINTMHKKYPQSLFYYSGHDVHDYIIKKYYHPYSSTELISNNTYIIFRAIRLNEPYVSRKAMDVSVFEELPVKYIDELGFDNMNPESKKIMQKLGLMKVPYKYYIYVLKRI